ncbi:Intracellular distribution of mitochondria, partial [Kickxella alabastrina]
MSTAPKTNENATSEVSQNQPTATTNGAAVSEVASSQEENIDLEAEANDSVEEHSPEEVPYQLKIKAPNGVVVPIIATSQETIQDLKQVVSETAGTIEYSCFYLTLNGQRLNDFVELGEIEGLEKEGQLGLVEDQYTEREARLHVTRLRDLLVGPTTANPNIAGLDAGASIFSTIKHPKGASDEINGESDSEEAAKPAQTNKAGKGGKKKNDGGAGGKQAAASGEEDQQEVEGEASAKSKPIEHAFKGYELGK